MEAILTGGDGTVLISINDSTVPLSLPDQSCSTGGEPIRAQSLSRLDNMLQDDYRSEAYYIYKCPSFPGLDRDVSGSARTLSTTHLETDSLSPRVSTTTISQDLEAERLGLAVMGVDITPLSRSASARTIDLGLRPAGRYTRPQLGSPPFRGRATMLRRSSSCPSIQCTRLVVVVVPPIVNRSGSVTKARPRPRRQQHTPPDDVNLEGENIDDLPIAPSRIYPDFNPELLDETLFLPSRQHNLSPLNATALSALRNSELAILEGEGIRRRTFRSDGVTLLPPGAGLKECDFIRVCESPRRHLIVERHPLRQKAPQLVDIKCLLWLNSLDNER